MKCGNENPVGAECCNLCGSELQGRTFAKQSKKQLATLLLFSFVNYLRNTLIALLLVVSVIVLACCILWRSDAPPLEDDYTIADLRSAPAGCAPSYKFLMSISEKDENEPDAPEIGLSEENVNVIREAGKVIRDCNSEEILELIEENAEGIEEAWRNGQKGRDIIVELNRFEEIADFTRPSMDAKLGFLSNLRNLAYLYHAYIFLEIGRGNEEEAMAELIELDMFFRKLSVNARSLVTKLVCIAAWALEIKTANFMVNNPDTSQETVELLAEYFEPFSEEQTSLRNSMMNEYLMCKRTLGEMCQEAEESGSLKYNSTLRLFRNHYDELVNREEKKAEAKNGMFSVWPWSFLNWIEVRADSEGKLPKIYWLYNPVGSSHFGILLPAIERVFEIRTKLEVHGDLLQIVLGKRLGKEVSLKARAYSDEYVIDIEEGIIFSPGPDGEVHTDDDIKLVVNPEVLGLVE